jgi:subtilisin family serine protease
MLRFHGRVVALWRGGQWGRAVRLEKASRLDGGELPEADAFVWAARNGDDVISFGGTSIACTGVAGVAALILAHNSALRWDQVREVLRQSCVRFDAAGGNYDASGRSPFYYVDRLIARKAVELALPPQPAAALVFQVVQDVPIADFQTATLALPVAGPGPLNENDQGGRRSGSHLHRRSGAEIAAIGGTWGRPCGAAQSNRRRHRQHQENL